MGPCRRERDLLGEHVPDGLGELAGDLHAADRGAALLAEAGLGALVVVTIDPMADGVDGGLDQGPAQVGGAVAGQRPAVIPTTGLVDTGHSPA